MNKKKLNTGQKSRERNESEGQTMMKANKCKDDARQPLVLIQKLTQQ
jgi:hypothetical protein